MEKKITLRICNIDVVVSADEEQELLYRKAAKAINDGFQRMKESNDVEDEKIMAFLLLQSSVKGFVQKQAEPIKDSLWAHIKRFLES